MNKLTEILTWGILIRRKHFSLNFRASYLLAFHEINHLYVDCFININYCLCLHTERKKYEYKILLGFKKDCARIILNHQNCTLRFGVKMSKILIAKIFSLIKILCMHRPTSYRYSCEFRFYKSIRVLITAPLIVKILSSVTKHIWA